MERSPDPLSYKLGYALEVGRVLLSEGFHWLGDKLDVKLATYTDLGGED